MDSHQLTALLNTLTSPLKSADAGDTLQPFWQWSLLAQALAPSLLTRQCRVVAVTGSQGSGKSTFAKILVSQLNALGRSAACVSLDDFYLSKHISDKKKLINNRNTTLSREQLAEKEFDESELRKVDVGITRLRQKIEKTPKQPQYIKTIIGKGYMLICKEI